MVFVARSLNLFRNFACHRRKIKNIKNSLFLGVFFECRDASLVNSNSMMFSFFFPRMKTSVKF